MLARIVLFVSLTLLMNAPASAQMVNLDFLALKTECQKHAAGEQCVRTVDTMERAGDAYQELLAASSEAHKKKDPLRGHTLALQALDHMVLFNEAMAQMQQLFPKVWATRRLVAYERL